MNRDRLKAHYEMHRNMTPEDLERIDYLWSLERDKIFQQLTGELPRNIDALSRNTVTVELTPIKEKTLWQKIKEIWT